MINYPASCLVLTIDGNNVTLNEKLNSSESQKWIRGPTNSEGYFTIKHKASGKFLTVDIDDKNGGTITKGMWYVCINMEFLRPKFFKIQNNLNKWG